MALIILEGLDRTGKSTVAEVFKEKDGYEIVHLSAPRKGITADEYLQEMVDIIGSAASRNIVLDRSHYGELIWPTVYGRKALLSEDDIEILREVEESVTTRRVLMHDKDAEAHWARCVANKEPLTKAQFLRARSLYSTMGHKYGFESLTLTEFMGKTAEELNASTTDKNTDDVPGVSADAQAATAIQSVEPSSTARGVHSSAIGSVGHPTKEQLKLEQANAINEILSKKILKQKGENFDKIEADLRMFLNNRLAELLGTNQAEASFSAEEIKFYKTMYKRAIEKKGDN